MTIPSTGTNIGICAFCKNNLTVVTIPKDVTLEDFAFNHNQLKKVIFLGSTTIGDEAFGYQDSQNGDSSKFIGWYTDETYSEDKKWDGKVNSPMTIYSKWKVKISFDGNGATSGDVPNEINSETGNSITLPDKVEIEKTLYKLDSWNTKADGTGKTYQLGSTFKVGQDDIIFYAMWKPQITPAFKASNGKINIINNKNKEDVINFDSLTIGATYKIYTSDKKTKLDEFTAEKEKESIYMKQIGETAGSIYISVTYPGYFESDLTEVKYAGEPSSAIATNNVKITNNYNKSDVITFEALKVGSTYSVYKDANKKTKIVSFKADKTSFTKYIDKKYLNPAGGSIYVTVKEPNYSESPVTKVNYKPEQLPSLSTKNVKVTNNIGNDKITLKGLTPKFTYTIYKDAKLKQKLTSFKATGTSKKLTRKLNDKAGAIYIVVSKSGYKSSTATKVAYKAQATNALSAKNIKITNSKKQDTIKLTGLKKGTTYVIYKDSKKKTKLASFKATNKTKTIKIKQLGKKAGKIYITAKIPGYEVSALTTVKYSKEK